MQYQIQPYETVRRFVLEVFRGYGFLADSREAIADVLLCADLFGIESHGIQRLMRYHNEILGGMVDVTAVPKTVHETPLSAVWDGCKAMGQTTAKAAMEKAMEKAKRHGVGMVAVRNSNHYGIAGYYTDMAARADLIGICMTNTEAIGVPTFGKRAMLGTNPIAYSFPAEPFPFLYDAATTVVPRGKLEVYKKNGKRLPDGWAVDADGNSSADAGRILDNIIQKAGGGIAPLGGSAELHGGHKGYGLGVIVDISTAILSQGMTSNYGTLTRSQSDIAQFFMAVDYGLFGNKAEMKRNLSRFLQELRDSDKAEGRHRIYTHGEKEYESRENKRREGIPINAKTWEEMGEIAGHHALDINHWF